MSNRNRWLDWQPKYPANGKISSIDPSKPSEPHGFPDGNELHDVIKHDYAKVAPTKPSEPEPGGSSDGFDGPDLTNLPVINGPVEHTDQSVGELLTETELLRAEVELWKVVFGATEATPCPDPVP